MDILGTMLVGRVDRIILLEKLEKRFSTHRWRFSCASYLCLMAFYYYLDDPLKTEAKLEIYTFGCFDTQKGFHVLSWIAYNNKHF